MKIYVGNLSYDTTEDDLRSTFEQFGKIDEINIIKDWETHKSKGFGFVTMRSKEEGESAIENLHETEFKGRALTVNKAHPRPDNHGSRGEHGEGKSRSGGGRGGFGGGRSGTRGDR